MSELDKLREMVKELAEVHEVAKEDIRQEDGDYYPLRARDREGRFLLLDSLTALVQAQSVLVTAELNRPCDSSIEVMRGRNYCIRTGSHRIHKGANGTTWGEY